MKNNPAKASLRKKATDLNQVGVDVMPSRYEIAKKAHFLHLNQARPQGRDVPVAWREDGTQTIDCHRDDRVRVIVRLAANPSVVVFRGQTAC